jgi:putative acetyltransferase
VVVLGHPDYYPRFGFVPSRNYNIASEYDVVPEVFMIIELQLDALTGQSGIARNHEAFAELWRGDFWTYSGFQSCQTHRNKS